MAAYPREFIWFVPFACIGLVVLALLRPGPVFPMPMHAFTVTDAEGVVVPVARPFRGVVLTWGAWNADRYLQNTKAPETLNTVGNVRDRAQFAKDFMSRVFPGVLAIDHIWNAGKLGNGGDRAAALEKLVALDAGAYLGNGGDFGLVPTLRRLGLPALTLGTRNPKDWDDYCATAARVEDALIGHPERAEAMIARHDQAVIDLAGELPPSLPHRRRVLVMGSWKNGGLYVKSVRNPYQLYLTRAGVDNASAGWRGEQPEAERILAMDPDDVFVAEHGQSPKDFIADPRWRGLKAVRDRHVYKLPGGLMGLIFQPVWTRWMAEIVYPDRLHPKVRQMLRGRVMAEFGYRMSDDEIDAYLYLDDNRDQPGYGRFTRENAAAYAEGAVP